MDMPLDIEKIFILKESLEDSITHDILKQFSTVPSEIITDAGIVYRSVSRSDDPVSAGKRALFLTRNFGRFLRPCPGTRHYRCCGYQILHIGAFCTMDCAYCVLQAFFHPGVLTFFTNHNELFSQLDQALQDPDAPMRRIGTGEFTDSLIWEPWTGLAPRLVERFAAQSRAVLELKTKTTNIESLRGLDHNRKTILAWSVNTPSIIASQERNTAPLSHRLEAAAAAQSWGFPVAFHFDPMVLYPGCEKEYQQTVELIFSHVSPQNVAWISLGSFRFMPDLKPIIEERFPGSLIAYGEHIRGMDGKMRYFKPLRIALYQAIILALRKAAPETCLYFCMEDDMVWQKSMGFRPIEKGGLPAMLDVAAKSCCGLSL